jgi:hypothetical protein
MTLKAHGGSPLGPAHRGKSCSVRRNALMLLFADTSLRGSIQTQANEKQRDFEIILKAFQLNHPDESIRGFDLDAVHSWQDVTDVVIAAVEEDDVRARKRSFKGLAALIGRSVSGAAPSIVNVLENSLPSGEWSSIACGAYVQAGVLLFLIL